MESKGGSCRNSRKNEESFPSCFRAGNIFESLFYGNKDGVVANERFTHLCQEMEQIVEEIEVVQIGSQERLQHGVVEQFIDFLVPQGAGETLAVVESFPQVRLAQRVVERIVDVLVSLHAGAFSSAVGSVTFFVKTLAFVFFQSTVVQVSAMCRRRTDIPDTL